MIDKEALDTAIDMVWSDYCDLNYWISDMNQRDQMIPKNVLKLAMKHLRDDFHKLHEYLAVLKQENCND